MSENVKDYPTIGHYVVAHKKEIAKALGVKEDTPIWGEEGLVNKFAQHSLAIDSIYSKAGKKATKNIQKGDYTDNAVRVNIDTEKYPPVSKDERNIFQKSLDAIKDFGAKALNTVKDWFSKSKWELI